MTTQEELAIRLKQLGIRVTPQRLAIAEVVINSGDHPSVKDVFERVKEFFPYVTLATVYATLDFGRKRIVAVQVFVVGGFIFFQFSI